MQSGLERLQNVEKFPYQITLGAITNDSLIYRMGEAIAAQCKRLGVHINLAPVADINNNAMNPVINYRSFGEDRERVTAKAMMYMKGLQDNGVLATLKHFPGHGDTNTDSHLIFRSLTREA
jgi:beta-glucosidase-like glycosyl hydrolase